METFIRIILLSIISNEKIYNYTASIISIILNFNYIVSTYFYFIIKKYYYISVVLVPVLNVQFEIDKIFTRAQQFNVKMRLYRLYLRIYQINVFNCLDWLKKLNEDLNRGYMNVIIDIVIVTNELVIHTLVIVRNLTARY